jgi:hypothetical protein
MPPVSFTSLRPVQAAGLAESAFLNQRPSANLQLTDGMEAPARSAIDQFLSVQRQAPAAQPMPTAHRERPAAQPMPTAHRERPAAQPMPTAHRERPAAQPMPTAHRERPAAQPMPTAHRERPAAQQPQPGGAQRARPAVE